LLQVLGDIWTSIMETKKLDTVDVNNLHKILGHCGEVHTRPTGKSYGYEVNGKFDICEVCSVGKARKKNVNKECSSMKGTSFGGSNFWALIIDGFSGYCWSYFLKKKNKLKDKVVELIKELKNKNIQVKFLRVDDARENYAVEKEYNQQNLEVKFEYSGTCTPQRIGKVEPKFQTLYGRIREIMNDSEIDGEFHDGLWEECAIKATYYDNLIINKEKKKCPIELMFKKKAKELKNHKRLGEMCMATTKNKFQAEIE
jgi:hypothetical protein